MNAPQAALVRRAGRTWEVVIGLETHVQLATTSKMFSGAATAFGAEPNTQACAIDLALPGVLPVANRAAVECAIRFGLAVGAQIAPRSVFARKNYFYPDLPKGYQISQYECPVVSGGRIPIGLSEGDPREAGERVVDLTRAHLEEDAGKSLHEDYAGFSGIDLNRAGTPLLEIVSEPQMHSSAEAVAYARSLHALVVWIGICDGNMQEGSFRIDANVSVRRRGAQTLGTRCEIKNLNSLRSLVRAIEHEAERQWDLTSAGGAVVQETRHWDEDAGRTIPGRSKEEAHDYRYFPEPDLVPVAPTAEMRERVRASMPELPAARRARLVAEWGIKDDDARVLVDVAGLADYAERAVAALADGGTARDVVNWVRQEVLAHCNDSGASPAELAPEMLAELVGLAAAGTISRVQAKDVLAESLAEGRWPRTIVEERGLAQVSDAGELGAVVDRVLAANPDVVAEFRAGDDKARKKKRGFIMGELMKELRGEGNPQVLNALLDERLA